MVHRRWKRSLFIFISRMESSRPMGKIGPHVPTLQKCCLLGRKKCLGISAPFYLPPPRFYKSLDLINRFCGFLSFFCILFCSHKVILNIDLSLDIPKSSMTCHEQRRKVHLKCSTGLTAPSPVLLIMKVSPT